MTTHYNADVLYDYLHGELAPEHDAAVHTHLESCADCQAVHADAASLRDWVRAAAHAEERDFPPAVAARVRAAIQTTSPTLSERLGAWWRPLLAFPVAAALVVALGLSFRPWQWATPPSMRIAATYYLEQHAAQTAGNPLTDRSTIMTVTALDRSAALPVIDAADTSGGSGAGGQ